MAAKPRGAKPPSINDRKVQDLIKALQYGNYMDTACKLAGVGVTTAYRWINEGAEETNRIAAGLTPDPKRAPYVEIMEGIEKARAESEARNVSVIQKAAQDGTWQASAWWLERTRPQKWGRFMRTEPLAPEDSTANMAVTDDDLESLVSRILGDGID
jgi:transposase